MEIINFPEQPLNNKIMVILTISARVILAALFALCVIDEIAKVYFLWIGNKRN